MSRPLGTDAATSPDAAEQLVPSAASSLLAATLDGIALLDELGRYVYVNPAGCEMLGASRDDLSGHMSFLRQAEDANVGSWTVRVSRA